MSFEYLTVIRDIIVSVAAIVTSTVAILGLKKWEEELKGKAEFEVARELLKSAYKVRDELDYFRSPLNSKEPPSDNSFLKLSEEEKREKMYQIYNEKLKPLYEAVREFNIKSREAEVLLGKDIQLVTAKLIERVNILYYGLKTYVEIKMNQDYTDREEQLKINREEQLKIKGIISTFQDRNEDFTKTVNAAIQAIEDIVRPHLRRN